MSLSCTLLEFQKGTASTGIGFLDHMLDQITSHAQIGVHLQVPKPADATSDANFNAQEDQCDLLMRVGTAVGRAVSQLIADLPNDRDSSFSCPLDEALVSCHLTKQPLLNTNNNNDCLDYNLAPYGTFPKHTGRTHIGKLTTAAVVHFWQGLATASGLHIGLRKVRGDNGHHIIESSFKAFSRCLRNYIDGVTLQQADCLYGSACENYSASLALQRVGTVSRSTKETKITVKVLFDGGKEGVSVQTGIQTLNVFYTELAQAADLSLIIDCKGDLWIDEHHTAEDVSISVGQCLNTALGTKAGLNRMWSVGSITMDLSNRPCFVHNINLERELLGDLSVEMFEHTLDSLTINARITVHMVTNNDPQTILVDSARDFGTALKYCAMIDQRRAGKTASSKGTLSV